MTDHAEKLAEALKLAESIGHVGSAPTEDERLLFEAWMRGHCWKVSGEWDGKQYRHASEHAGDVHPPTMMTRQLFAAWRDRGALAAYRAQQEQAQQLSVLTAEQCDEFRRLPLSFRDMVRAIYAAGEAAALERAARVAEQNPTPRFFIGSCEANAIRALIKTSGA